MSLLSGSIGSESGIQAPLRDPILAPNWGLTHHRLELCDSLYLDDGHTLIVVDVVDAARRRPGRGRLRTLWCSRRSLPQFVPLSETGNGMIV